MTGSEVRELRKLKKLTQKKLSELSGVPSGTIARIEASENEEVKKTEVEKALRSVLLIEGDTKNAEATSDLKKENEHLKQLVIAKDKIIADKEEIINLLKMQLGISQKKTS